MNVQTLNKKMPEFWKTYGIKKFCKNLSSHTTVDGHSNGTSYGSEIAVVFADKFRSVYYDSAIVTLRRSRNMCMNFRMF